MQLKKNIVLLGAIVLIAISCNETPKDAAPTSSDTEQKSTDRDKIRQEATEFEKNQNERISQINKSHLDSFLLTNLAFKAQTILGETAPIDIRLAYSYINKYKTETPPTTIQSAHTIKRTEAVWIDKKAISYFMETMLKDTSLDGIRVYFAQYPLNVEFFDPKIDTANRSRKTIIFLATKRDGNKHVDHFPSASGAIKMTDGLYIYDYNSLCPDVCEGAILGDH